MMRFPLPALLLLCAGFPSVWALTPAEQAKLPAPASHAVDFGKEIKPLFEAACIKCHAKGKAKGGFSLETREAFLNGGETGPGAVPGRSAESLVVEMVSGIDPDSVMPKKGSKWTPEQVGLLRAWIDQGAPWPAEISFARPAPSNLQRHDVTLPQTAEGHPVDRLLAPYFAEHKFTPPAMIDDAHFARRAYLDAIGLLPTPEQLEAFFKDSAPDKRAKLVHQLLAENRAYADHWLSFWNDLLRNDYKGTGFIDGGRKQISEWLYDALLTNKPYDRFVAELVNPNDQSLGFSAGIIWRGTVPAAMAPPMQAAQSVSQVFMGINLKCASCHDSFVNDWSLADAYGMAAIFAENALELIHCDKPTGQKVNARFLYPALGEIPMTAARGERLQKLASVLASPQNGRLSRTLVNRLWARLLGRSLVEPLDDMDQPAWSPALLDWLAEDFAAHHCDVRHLLEVIMTSRAYQLPVVETPPAKEAYVFCGPISRRLSAEQYADAVSALTEQWAALPSTLEFDFSGGADGHFTLPRWLWTNEPLTAAPQRVAQLKVKQASDAAQTKAAKAQQLAEKGDPGAAAAAAEAKAAAESAAAVAAWAPGYQEIFRHKVGFRKQFTLPEKPPLAYGIVSASQLFEVQVNGRVVKHKMADGARNGRVRLYDFTPFLQAGSNLIVVSTDSHTEKQMNDIEARQFPQSQHHLNANPGFACFIRARCPSGPVDVISDESWHARRAPEGSYTAVAFDDKEWANAIALPQDKSPIDEGPGLEPLRRKDFANIPVQLGPALRAACSTAALAEKIRAAQLAADPLQTALDRPNREIVTPARSNAPTTLQALELTNGGTLNNAVQWGAAKMAPQPVELGPVLERLYTHALSRKPRPDEVEIARAAIGDKATHENVADLIWATVMLPEFQFIE